MRLRVVWERFNSAVMGGDEWDSRLRWPWLGWDGALLSAEQSQAEPRPGEAQHVTVDVAEVRVT
jgi:hypothetical protein